jgi:hypothetical protein
MGREIAPNWPTVAVDGEPSAIPAYEAAFRP